MIDTSENLIIIKGQIKTAEIESCQNDNGNYKILFRNSSSAYTYKEENVLWLTSPEKPAPNDYQIVSKGRTLSNIEALYVFYAGKHSYIGTFVFRMAKSMIIKEKICRLPNHV